MMHPELFGRDLWLGVGQNSGRATTVVFVGAKNTFSQRSYSQNSYNAVHRKRWSSS
jgi:hypothetical protein